MNLSSFLSHKMKKIFSVLHSIKETDTYRQINKCDILLMCHDHDLGISLNEKAYSPLIDSMLEELKQHGWDCRRFALPYSNLVGNKAFANPVSANRRLLLSKLIMQFFKTFRKMTQKNHSDDIDFSLSAENFYFEFFKKIECKCIVGIGLNRDICKASNKLGIFSVEILHGLGLPEISSKLKELEAEALPKGILSFDTISTKAYSALASKNVIIKQTPHIWLNRFKDEKRTNLPAEWQQKIKTNPKYQKNILITLQWGYDGEAPLLENILDNGILSESIVDAIKDTANDIFWWIRLHPVQRRSRNYAHHEEYLEKLSKKFENCEWKDASSLPLPLLLQQCDAHITMISGASYDASFFGIPSLLLCPTLRKGGVHENYFSDLLASNKASLGTMSTKDILEWVYNAPKVQRNDPSEETDIEEIIKWLMGKVAKR